MKNNISLTAIAMACVFSAPAFAVSPCKVLEFAELQSLSSKELQMEHCFAKMDRVANRKISALGGSAGDAAADKCIDEIKRMERVMDKKKIKPMDCPKGEM